MQMRLELWKSQEEEEKKKERESEEVRWGVDFICLIWNLWGTSDRVCASVCVCASAYVCVFWEGHVTTSLEQINSALFLWFSRAWSFPLTHWRVSTGAPDGFREGPTASQVQAETWRGGTRCHTSEKRSWLSPRSGEWTAVHGFFSFERGGRHPSSLVQAGWMKTKSKVLVKTKSQNWKFVFCRESQYWRWETLAELVWNHGAYKGSAGLDLKKFYEFHWFPWSWRFSRFLRRETLQGSL